MEHRLYTLLRLYLGLMVSLGGLMKLTSPECFDSLIADCLRLNSAVSQAAGTVFALLQLLSGAFVLFGLRMRESLSLSLFLSVASTALLTSLIARGIDVLCPSFGPGPMGRVDIWLLLREGTVFLASVVLLVGGGKGK